MSYSMQIGPGLPSPHPRSNDLVASKPFATPEAISGPVSALTAITTPSTRPNLEMTPLSPNRLPGACVPRGLACPYSRSSNDETSIALAGQLIYERSPSSFPDLTSYFHPHQQKCRAILIHSIDHSRRKTGTPFTWKTGKGAARAQRSKPSSSQPWAMLKSFGVTSRSGRLGLCASA